jgi:dTDP-4-dehydrorhamnose 3,5-epimerase
MNVIKTALDGAMIIEPDVFADERGFFMETFEEKRYQEVLGIAERCVQDNLSMSKKGVLRGLHYQIPPFGQGKLVSVLSGKVLDVVVDIRSGSPTFGKHIAVELSEENHKQLFIPAGFAHGFVVLSDTALFSYKCTNVYSKEHDRGILWNVRRSARLGCSRSDRFGKRSATPAARGYRERIYF